MINVVYSKKELFTVTPPGHAFFHYDGAATPKYPGFHAAYLSAASYTLTDEL
jgi:hypothetical protein